MSDFVVSPMKPIGSCPDGYKGSGTHEYDGEDGAFSGYKRTSTSNGVPEVMEDGNVGPISGEKLGKDGEHE